MSTKIPEKQIGATGFEPAATSTPYWCANQTALRPDRQFPIIRHFFEIHKEECPPKRGPLVFAAAILPSLRMVRPDGKLGRGAVGRPDREKEQKKRREKRPNVLLYESRQ